MLSKYDKLLASDPVKTKMLTSGFMFACGDLICQVFLNGRKDGSRPKVDWRRFTKMVLIGTFVLAPTLHVWYGYVAAAFTAKFPKLSALQKALAAMVIDQTVFTIPFSFVLLFVINFLDHFNAKKSLKDVLDILPNYLVKNWMVWAPATLINFAVIPEPKQVLFSNLVGFVWNIYVSYISNKASKSGEIQTKKN
mmetsp:Transcript_8840/g.9950  ORF Transcript_8840/g.9950 Transcript_8840/m.9950 type:complete len:194 (+) Transcript_8840:39-620(+)